MSSRRLLVLTATAGYILCRDVIPVSWNIYLQSSQSSSVRSVPRQAAFAQVLQQPASTASPSFGSLVAKREKVAQPALSAYCCCSLASCWLRGGTLQAVSARKEK